MESTQSTISDGILPAQAQVRRGDAEKEEVVSHDCDTYLQKLHTLMIAYALAGVAPLPGVGSLGQLHGICGGASGRTLAVLLSGTEVSTPAACGQALAVGDQIPGEHPVVGICAQAPQPQTIPAQAASKEPTQMSCQFLAGLVISGKPTAQRMNDGTKLCGGFETANARTRPPGLKGLIAAQ